ncbi:hypothetical protein BOVMAS33_07380 [Streptococcus uberis]
MKDIEDVQFSIEIGSLVLYTAKSIISDDNLLKSQGKFIVDGRKFKITVEEVEE